VSFEDIRWNHRKGLNERIDEVTHCRLVGYYSCIKDWDEHYHVDDD
jgi:hypothetical protein